MTLMQVREMRLCPTHRTAVVQLDDARRGMTMTFSAEAHEAGRLARVMEHGPGACHPVFDFVRALLSSLEAGVARIVLDDVQGEGISGLVYVGWGGTELPVPCYPPDAIALALRAGVPIYATAAALSHARPAPLTVSRLRGLARSSAPRRLPGAVRRAARMIVCLCAGVPATTILAAIERGAACPEDLTAACGAGGDCGACLDSLGELLSGRGGGATLDLASR